MYTVKGAALEDTETEKDLGVYMDHDLKFRRQAAAAVSKASRVMAAIRRSFRLLDKSTLPVLYKALVRPPWNTGTSCGARLTGRTNSGWKKFSEEQRS